MAEGVETDDQQEILSEAGCDMVQGYQPGRPMPLATLLHRLARHAG